MSANAVPAAVPGPNDPPGSTPAPGPAAGLLASMVAPVQPARATFNLNPAAANTPAQTGPADLVDPAPQSASSDSFHADESTTNATDNAANNKTAGKPQTGIWRAWLVAGATRWGKGGGTQNKRLDMKKARAQAQQVKETRTVTINRTPAGGGGGTSRTSNATGPAGGKGLGGKSGGGGASKGPQKNIGPGSKNGTGPGSSSKSGNTGPGGLGGRGKDTGSGGSGAGNGRGTGSGGAGATKNTPAPKQPKPPKADTPVIPKQRKTDTATPKPSKGGAGTGNGSDQKNNKPGAGAGGTKGPAGTSGKDGASPKTPAPAKDTKPTGGATGPGKDTKAPKSAAGPTERKKWSLTKGDKPAKPNTKTPPAAGTGKGSGADEKQDAKGKPDPKTATDPKPVPGRGKPFSVKESRETGYRDGTRAARTTAHVKAYRDGIKDGWADTMTAAEREKTRLDQAHTLRKKQLEHDKEQQVTATSADHHQAQPIEVTNIDSTHVHLGAGATRNSVTRGEVRSLKAFERRLEAKVAVLLKGAEQARTLQAHAAEQAREATQLLEQARGSKAGEKVLGSLLKTQEATTAQIRAAEDLYKRAIRGAEQSAAVLANVKTRYEPMYTAVVNSPETKPAEMSFYQDGAHAHA